MWKVFLVNKHLKPAALLENMKEFYTPSVYDLEVVLAACMVLAKDVVLQMRVRFGRLCPCCVRCWPPIARVGHQRINYCSASFHSPSNHRGLLDWRDKKKCSPAGSNPHQRALAPAAPRQPVKHSFLSHIECIPKLFNKGRQGNLTHHNHSLVCTTVS